MLGIMAWFHGHRGLERISALELSVLSVLLLVAGTILWVLSSSVHEPEAGVPATRPVPAKPSPSAFTPPAHSVAVLPFINMSGDASQEYFSDGLSEELLNSLSRIDGLQIAARTSSFRFKGKDVDIETIARKLNVGAVLEGSIRKSGETVRITTQLVNSATGFHLWSRTFDRNLKDILAVETEVATAVAQQLQVKLLGNEVSKIQASGTRSPKGLEASACACTLLSLTAMQ
jgi:adenylate cyclase